MRIILLLLATSTALTLCDIPERENAFKKGLQEIAVEPRTFHKILSTSVFKINSSEVTGRPLFQSDILLTEKQKHQIFKNLVGGALTKRQVLRKDVFENSTWDDGVFYAFNTSDPAMQKFFKLGAKVWSDATCIDFVEDNNAQDKVVLVKEPESYSSVGRIGGDQLLSLDERKLTVGSAAHEIGHVLGLFHTMSRYDRDSYIKIVERNVHPDQLEEFKKLDISAIDVYGLAYDYGSIMHYTEMSFSLNRNPTMLAVDRRYQKTMGSDLVAFSDIFQINEHYGCNAKCDNSTSAKCVNEGYPHPRNCSICICPSGYGGTLCDRRPPGCGEDLMASNDEQMISYSLGIGYDFRDQFDFCIFMIEAPQGKRIEVDVKPISPIYDFPGCRRGGVEVKAQRDQKLTGYRFCSKKGSKGPIVSSSNRLPVILYNRLGTMEANFTYRYID